MGDYFRLRRALVSRNQCGETVGKRFGEVVGQDEPVVFLSSVRGAERSATTL